MRNALIFNPSPSSATATRPAEITPRQRAMSMRGPAYAMSAGSNVSDATSVTNTTTAAPMPNPLTNSTPMVSMPSSEMITVMPAKATARPDVSSAIEIDSSEL